MGDKINKEYAKKSTLAQSIEQALNNYEFVGDDTVIEIVRNELEKYQTEKKSYIIEGFPMTMAQGLYLQRMNIIPTAFLVINLSDDKIVACCVDKLSKLERFRNVPPAELQRLAELHKTEYLL